MSRFQPSKAYHLQPSSMLRQFEVLGVLGQGGFALTYLGVDTTLEREVVIKEYFPNALAHREPDGSTVSPRLEEEYVTGLDYFFQEAQALGQLQHPHIVDVLDVFQANDTAYFVMPYYEGQDLETWLRNRGAPLDPHEAVELLRPMLHALEYVHGEGLIHRDVKPANVLLAQRGGRLYPILLDFGGARQFVAGVTQTYDQILSLGYAPFEQYSRQGKQGPWTDVYACGAMFYRLTVGDRPPDAAERQSGRALDLASLPVPFAAVVETALAPRAEDRYQDVGEFERALQESVAGPPPAQGRSPHVASRVGGASAPGTFGGGAAGAASAVPARSAPPSSAAPQSEEEMGRQGGCAWWVWASLILTVVAGAFWWAFLRVPVVRASTAVALERHVLTARAGSIIEVTGSHVLSRTLELDRPLTLRGVGEERPQLRFDDALPLLRYTGEGRLELENLHIAYVGVHDANAVEIESGELVLVSSMIERATPSGVPVVAQGQGRGLRLSANVSSARIVDVHFMGSSGPALEAGGATLIELERSVFDGNGRGAVFSDDVDAALAANQFVQNSSSGLELTGRAQATLVGDRFVGNGGYGLHAAESSSVEARDVLLEENHTGLVVAADASASIENSRLRHNKAVGAYFRGTGGGMVRNNQFESNGIGGLMIHEAADPDVSGNRFELHSSYGIQSNCRASLSDNSFAGNAAEIVDRC